MRLTVKLDTSVGIEGDQSLFKRRDEVTAADCYGKNKDIFSTYYRF